MAGKRARPQEVCVAAPTCAAAAEPGAVSEILLARDHDFSLLRRALSAGEVERLRRGAYRTVDDAETGTGAAARARLRAEQLVVAVHRQLTAAHVISHVSAALLLGAPLWRTPREVHVIQQYGANASGARDIVRHRTRLVDDEVVRVAGVPVTSPERTVLDCLTTVPPLDGLVLADWALAQGMRRDTLLSAVATRPDRRNRRRARLVVELADAGAQSPWETWTRYVLLRAGFPRPRTQVPVSTRLGTFHADVGWDEWGPLLEFDGFVKYRDEVPGRGRGYAADVALFEEKRREDAIREAGRTLLRVTARDSPAELVRRVLRHTEPGRRPRLRPLADLPPV